MKAYAPARGRGLENGCLPLFGAPFAIIGVGLAIATALHPPAVRDLIMRVTASIIFSAVGFGLIALNSVAHRMVARRDSLVKQNPDRPWLWREDWAQGFAEPDARETGVTYSLMGAMLLLFSVPMALNFQQEFFERRNHAILIALIFPLTGILLLSQSLLIYFRGRKFRSLRFTLRTNPAATGGLLEGTLTTQYLAPHGQTMELTLSCIRSYMTGSGDSRSRWHSVLWQDKTQTAVMASGHDSSAPVRFQIPYDTQPTDDTNPQDEIVWKLSASASLPGLDLRATFPVPVFRTPASDPSLTQEKLPPVGSKPERTGIQAGPSQGGGARFYFAPARNKTVAALLTVFGLLCLGGGLFFGLVAGRAFGWIPFLGWIFGAIPLVISGGIGLVLLCIAAWLWFGTTAVEVINRELHIRSGWLGISRTRVVAAADIQKFELYPGMQRGEEVWYDLKLRLANGRSMTAGSGMEQKEAEWFLAELKKDLGK